MTGEEQRVADFSLSGKTALVTGGGSGLGKELSTALAEYGAKLILVGRDSANLEETADSLPGNHTWVSGDLLSNEVYAEIAARPETIDILVNNAGGDVRKGHWLEQTPEDWRVTLELNVVAPSRLAQIVAPAMVNQRWGRIINISSVYGFLGQNPRNSQPGLDSASYIAGKHAVLGLTRFLAGRLGADGITANAISPGMFPLDPDDPALATKPWKRMDPKLGEQLAAGAPVGRVGRKGDLGAAVVFLASPAAGFVTGQNLAVDGGWSVW